MNRDYTLLLSTVLSESGCIDPSLQETAETVPLVYRALAEHNVYAVYLVSVLKALLHDHEGAFAYLIREQAQRQKKAGATSLISAPLPPDVGVASSSIPPLLPSDSLDMHLSVIGGGTCCQLMLQLICGRGRTGGVGGGGIVCDAATRDPLVHPSHITVVTRQPERLAPFAELGVHCLTRHHGRQAIAQSDVVALAFPPAKLGEVTKNLSSSSPVEPSTCASSSKGTTAKAASSPPTEPALSLLRPNAVLLSCMAGVPVRKVANAFRHVSPDLIFTPFLYTFSVASPPNPTTSCDGDNAPSTVARSVMLPAFRGPLSSSELSTDIHGGATLEEHSLEEAGKGFTDAMVAYRSARIAEMRISTSFLRPAVLQKAAASAAEEAARANKSPLSQSPGKPGGMSFPAGVVQPQLTSFSAGRHPSTCPTIAAYMSLWRALKAYIQTTFAEEMMRAGRVRGGGGPGPSHSSAGKGVSYGGLVNILLPDTSSKNPCMSGPGEVEADLLPALVLLPANQTRVLWDAWWGNEQSRHVGEDGAISSLPPPVTEITGLWLSRVYTSLASFKAHLDVQYAHILGSRAR